MPPDSSPPATGPSPRQFKCHAHHHMTATEYAIWSVCRAMSTAQNGIVFFSGPRIAQKFREMGRNTPYTALAELRRMGWFKRVKDSYTRSDGTWTPTHYRVLSHEEWAAEHPLCCPDPWQSEPQEPSQSAKSRPSQLKGTAEQPSQLKGSPSQLKGYPSQPEGTNLYKQPIENTDARSSVLQPSQLEGTALITRFNKRRRQRSASAIERVPQPFPQVGTAVSDTETPKHSNPQTKVQPPTLPLGMTCRDGRYFTAGGVEVSAGYAEMLIGNYRS